MKAIALVLVARSLFDPLVPLYWPSIPARNRALARCDTPGPPEWPYTRNCTMDGAVWTERDYCEPDYADAIVIKRINGKDVEVCIPITINRCKPGETDWR
jgi:hypothetical protein